MLTEKCLFKFNISENEGTKLTYWKKGINASAFYFFSCYIQVLFESHLPSQLFAPTKLLVPTVISGGVVSEELPVANN